MKNLAQFINESMVAESIDINNLPEVSGQDDATGDDVTCYGGWIQKSDKNLKKKLQEIADAVKKKTKLDFVDISEFSDDAPKDGKSFDAWFDYIVKPSKKNGRVHSFCIMANSEDADVHGLMIADDDTVYAEF